MPTQASDTQRRIAAGEAAEPVSREGLDRSLIRGIAWTGGVKWTVQIVSWATTLIVARLLVPADFGIMGMATLILGFISLVNEFGLGGAIIQRKEIDEDLIAHLGGFSLATGIGFTLLGAAIAVPVAAFFHEPRVRAVMFVLSLNFTITSPAMISRALLTRNMRFKELALTDGANTVMVSVLTTVLAWVGWGYWSLVAGSVVSNLFSTAVYMVLQPFRPRYPRRLSAISREVKFGGHLVGSRVAWYAYSNADFGVVGRFLGTAALGAYNLGWTLASVPVDKISVLLMQVTPPVFARVQDQPRELRRYLHVLTLGLSVLTFPAGLGMALVAPDFVPLVLGPKWAAAVGPLQILALYGGFRSLTPFYAQILVATDHARLSMYFGVLTLLIMVPAFVLGAHWGPTGVALAWVVAYPSVVAAFHIPTTFRIIGLRVGEYVRSLWPAVSGCLMMAAAVYGARLLLPSSNPSWPRLISEIAAGIAAYAGCLLTLHRERVQVTLGFIRRLRST